MDESTTLSISSDGPSAPFASSTDCARCGDCCRAVRLGDKGLQPYIDQPERAANLIPSHRDDLPWLALHWHPISSEEASRRLPGIAEGETDDTASFYTCDAFDSDRNLCTVEEHKPAVCRSFPWYGRQPTQYELAPYPRCSYWRDVPRESWPPGTEPLDYIPLEVVKHGDH